RVAERVVERAYVIAYRGARIGDASERETWREGGVTLEQRERTRVRRGGAIEGADVRVVITADRDLRATSVSWRSIAIGGGAAARDAIREPDGWRIEIEGEPARRAPAAAVPDELVPLIARERGAFRGDVLLDGSGFALAHREVVASGPRAMRATLDGD